MFVHSLVTSRHFGESMRECLFDSKLPIHIMFVKKIKKNSRRVFEKVDANIRELKTTRDIAVFVSSCDGTQQANQRVLGKLSKKKKCTRAFFLITYLSNFFSHYRRRRSFRRYYDNNIAVFIIQWRNNGVHIFYPSKKQFFFFLKGYC